MSARRTRRPLRCPLRLQALEGRIAPATFTVTNANNSGTGSLRQVVINANNTSVADLIDFSSFFNVPRTITLASEISITRAVTIDGPSAGNVVISGNNAVRIFNTQSAAAGTSISLVDLTLNSGHVATTESGGAVRAGDEALNCTRCIFTANIAYDGGAIGVVGAGSLTATDCVFTSNSAPDGGGAIWVVSGGSVTATGCVFTLNSAPYGGGALIVGVGGSLNATNCLFTSNWAGSGGAIEFYGGSLTATDCVFTSNAAGIGGAIAVHDNSANTVLTRCEISGNNASYAGGLRITGNLLLEASTVSGNLAPGYYGYGGYYPGYGGGIVVTGNAVTIRNSTISGNSAGEGGGIVANGTLVVQNSTITRNTASYGGGGIFAGGATIALESSIVAKNSGSAGADIVASRVSAKNSSVFDRTGIATFTDLGGNRPVGEDPRLGSLQDNGGPTKTHLLLPGSSCVNAGSNPANLTTDQRGPGFPRVLNGAIDIGAAEGVDVTPAAIPISIPPTITVAGGTNFTVVVRYDDDVGIDLSTIDLGDITVTGPGYAAPQAPTARSISGSGAVVTVTYIVPAPGGTFDFTDGGVYTVAMVANQVGDIDSPVHHFVAAGTLGSFRVAIPGVIEVDEASDIDDGNITDGHVSLREALRLTNAAVGTADVITFDPAVFGSPRTITMSGGQFVVTDSLSVIGPGSGLLTLNAGGASGVFYVPSDTLMSLSGMTLTNGALGAIFATARLSLSDIAISNNQSVYSVGGGGIYLQGSLTMIDCIVSNNRVTGSNAGGGGIYVSGGPVVIDRSSILNNEAGGSGGGLYAYSPGTLQISDSTFSGNLSNTYPSGLGGGGISIYGDLAPGSFIRNSTISGNVAANGSPGGGLSLYFYGTLAIANSTITGNSTSGQGGGIAVSNYYVTPNISLNSSIIAGNSAGGAANSGPDLCFLYFNVTYPFNVPGDNNLLGVANSGSFALTGSGNRTGTVAAPLDARLGPLANNGGPTKTHALLSGSPAINAGNNADGLAYDQRGTGFTRVAGAAADIGAFEVQTAPPTAIVQINDGAAQRSRITNLTATFSTHVTFAGAVGNAFTLSRNGGGAVNFTATANVVGGATVVTLTSFTGSEAQFGSLKDGRYTLTVLASQISAGGLALDGDGDGLPGGNLIIGDAQGLFRFYGDINGDRHVDIADFGLFSSTFNLSTGQTGFLAAFDFNGDGHIDIADFGQFSVRMFTVLP
jgi:Dockerin type I domain/Chlamydia polymorphic membrane protein (Chlamydia_PMP) repeat